MGQRDNDVDFYGSSRYLPEYLESRIVHSVDGFTGRSRPSSLGGRSTGRAGQYINNAFSFLNSDDYNAYKYYNDREGPTVISNGHTNGHANSPSDWYSNSNAYNYPKNQQWSGSKDPNYASQLKIIKIAILILVIFLAIVIAVGTAMYFIFRNNNDATTQETYRFIAEIKFNTSWNSAYADKSSAQYQTLSTMLVDGMGEVFKSGAFSSIYNSTKTVEFRRSDDGHILAKTLLHFHDPEGKFKKDSLAELVQGEIIEELPSYVSEPIYSIIVTAAGTVDPSPPDTPGYTTAAPTSLPEQEVDCVPVTEPLCQGFYSQTGPSRSTAAENFITLHKATDRNCYDHTTQFVCAAIYPQCQNRKLRKPCRIFCESFRSACNVPIICDLFPNDDEESACITEPGYSGPAPPSPPPDPCNAQQFRCGTDPPTCIPSSQKCGTTQECADGSDVTSPRANCASLIASPLQCDFSDGDICDYTQSSEDEFDWSVIKPPTASAGTGAYYDLTTLTTNGYVLVAEASGQRLGSRARLESAEINTTEERCLNFYYHMNGIDVGYLKVLTVNSNGEEHQLWYRAGDQENYWKKGEVTLPVGTKQVIYQAERGQGYQGDISLDDISLTPGTCTRTGCDGQDFTCANNNCIPASKVCNAISECGDFSDEMNCTCTEGDFHCAMGMCIKGYMRCDGKNDCPDDSDEMGCGQVCSHGRHKCINGECIMPEQVCDGDADCGDSSDELNCPTCSSLQFQCSDFICVVKSKQCDGNADCGSGNDEHGCFKKEDDNSITITKNTASGKVSGLLCVENLSNTGFVNNELCKQIGLGDYESRGTLTKASATYLKVKTGATLDGTQSVLSNLEISDDCNNNQVLTISCKPKACGQVMSAGNQIVNGDNALDGKWPWAAVLFLKSADGTPHFTCGGTIITEQHILTAAHCIGNLQDSPERFEVLVGTVNKNNRASPAQLAQVLEITLAPQYSAYYLGDDLAVLELHRKLTFDQHVQPICLPSSQDVYGAGSKCYSIGWGKTEAGTTSDAQKQAKQPPVDYTTCNSQYDITLNTMSVCAGYESGYITNCQGDSGGPLMCQSSDDSWSLVGVYSFGQDPKGGVCQSPEKASVFTKVQSFLPWIESQIQCAYDCGNGECLYNAALKCDGHVDCANRQDELNDSCPSSISCDFSDSYICGYNALTEGSIVGPALKQGMASPIANKGPITGHTDGTLTDTYVYGQNGLTGIVAPIYDKTKAHCLSFYLQMRGESTARFRVFSKAYTGSTPWTLEITTLTASDYVFDHTGSIYTGWLRYKVDIPSGQRLIGFVMSSTGDVETGIGLDDVDLSQGTCSTVGCPSNHLECVPGLVSPSGSATCIETSAGACNYVKNCPLTGTDEETNTDFCSTTDLQEYVCNFDNYNDCALSQHHATSDDAPDEHDWRLVVASAGTINQPAYDATTPDTHGGHFLLMDTRASGLGKMATVSLHLGYNRNGIGCFTFKYWMHSTGSLKVTIDAVYEPWQIENVQSTGWTTVRIAVLLSENDILITGIVGTNSNGGSSFIAIDDLHFAEGVCENPDCSADKYACNDGRCIEGKQFCDGNNDCPNSEDEPNGCRCRNGYYECEFSRGCLDQKDVCDGSRDCPGASDERGCACTSTEFQCGDELCIPNTEECNRLPDCFDGTDEKECECNAGEFQCTDGQCILNDLSCNGVDDCLDGSDEMNCDSLDCRSYQFKCDTNTAEICVANDQRCDGIFDCQDESDEANCDCPNNSEFWCNTTSVTCLPPSARCNGMLECESEVDETGCGSNTVTCAGAPSNCDCGKVSSSGTNQIVGGKMALDNTWPWTAAIYFEGRFICGGVLISDKWVLTAAHCFFQATAPNTEKSHVSDYRVRVNTVQSLITDGGTVYRVEKYLLHPGYSYGVLEHNDLALIKLASAVSLSSSVKPICMPEDAQDFTPNSECVTIGWGYVSGVPRTPRFLREARMRVYTDTKCGTTWTSEATIDTTKQLCAGYETALIHTCNGDSGSPLICKDAFTDRWQLAGLTSGGHSDCDRDTQVDTKPTVYTRVSAFNSWIEQTLGND